jgi:hypothetical protein
MFELLDRIDEFVGGDEDEDEFGDSGIRKSEFEKLSFMLLL